MLTAALCVAAQTTVQGMVTDGREPLAGANVFIIGTLDGCLTDSLGRFEFTTSQTGELTLRVMMMGFDDTIMTITKPTGLVVRMHERATAIDEVVVTASTYSFGRSDNFKTMDALDVVMAGNSCGDIVAALQTLPGTQKVGEDGKLYVRGGDDSECQTFVNGMHVMVPYTTAAQGSASRGRFSPFLFKGINFSLGGYGGEFGQALSAVLPMETTDVATADKMGISASLVDWNVGGTKAFDRSSLSFNGVYTSMGAYDALFPDRYDWTRPYSKLSGEAQYKADLSAASVLKTYVGYDFTTLGQHIGERHLSLSEHSTYANATLKTSMAHGWNLFAGIAHSALFKDVDDAQTTGDHYYNFRGEIHLKAEARKVFSPILKMSAGAEGYFRNSTMRYDFARYNLAYHLLAAHADAQMRLVPRLFLNLSARAEHESCGHEWLIMPRTTLSYVPNKRLQFSALLGQYSQTADDDLIVRGNHLPQATATHAILSMQYAAEGTLLRIEPYYKKYRHLPLMQGETCTDGGYGTSRGFDLFLENHTIVKRLTTTVSYSFNDAERLYLDYTEPRMPHYASRHNLRVTAKYNFGKTIIGISNTYASGRKNPDATPHYNSLDANVTLLVSPKVIVYTSLNNILGRTNIFGHNADGTPVTASRDRFFYIGIFVSLKNNKAYEISNF